MTITHVKEIEKVQIRYLRRIISTGTDFNCFKGKTEHIFNDSFVISMFFRRDEGYDEYQILYLKQSCKKNKEICTPNHKMQEHDWKTHDCQNPIDSNFFSHMKNTFVHYYKDQSYSEEPKFDEFHCIFDGEEEGRIILNESEKTNINICFDICQIPIKDKYDRYDRHEKISKFIVGKISEHIQSLPKKKNYFLDDCGNRYYDFENKKLFNVGLYLQNHQNSDMFIS